MHLSLKWIIKKSYQSLTSLLWFLRVLHLHKPTGCQVSSQEILPTWSTRWWLLSLLNSLCLNLSRIVELRPQRHSLIATRIRSSARLAVRALWGISPTTRMRITTEKPRSQCNNRNWGTLVFLLGNKRQHRHPMSQRRNHIGSFSSQEITLMMMMWFKWSHPSAPVRTST
jgi:hypothetical protein